ncbi:MAG: prolyl oligopeptidase family serine peptidase [Microscillaceae bacterium]|nr:prolyl oligopeptidase family serine peptidase [Microscillaceae bacterium]
MKKNLGLILSIAFFLAQFQAIGQSKRPLDFEVYEDWKSIQGVGISPDGKWVIYSLKAQNKDAQLMIHDISSREEKSKSFDRGEQAVISDDSRYVIFTIKPIVDSLKALRRQKVKKEKLPKEGLGIYHLMRDSLVEIPEVRSFKLPKKSGNWLAYHLEASTALPIPKAPKIDSLPDSTQFAPEDKLPEKQDKKEIEPKPTDKKDKKTKENPKTDPPKTTPVIIEENPLEIAQKKIQALEQELKRIEDEKKAEEERKKIKPKKPKVENDENGSKLILRNLTTSRQDTFLFVTAYEFDEKGRKLAFASTGNDSTFKAGVYVFDLETLTLAQVLNQPGKHINLSWDKEGTQLVFVSDVDTTQAHKKAPIKYFDLYHWQEKQKTALKIAGKNSPGLPNNWMVSEFATLEFSKDGSKLFFGTQPEPLVQDTTLLPEEIVKVDIWNWQDARLQSQQIVELERDKKKSYLAVVYPKLKKIIQLGSPEIPEIIPVSEGNAEYVLAKSNVNYQRESSWEGYPSYSDVYIINLRDGRKQKIKEKLRAEVDISPGGQYVYWYARSDSSWYVYAIRTAQTLSLTKSINNRFYDELDDYPDAAGPYGSAGWTENDLAFLVYDRYDIWKLDPLGKIPAQRLTTNGRENRITYRYVPLDPEIKFIKSTEPLVLSAFDQETRASGYFSVTLGKNEAPRKLILDDFLFEDLKKPRDANKFLFTRQSFTDYPNLYYSDATFTKINPISDANPQQNRYWWGNVELVKWTAPNGEELSGLLYKPENFDPGKKYPLIAYFYERLSQNLHRYYAPLPARSAINPSMYASNGYLVFMPDIPYQVGHPGQSAYDAVVSGVTSLLKTGFVDRDKMGIQGHSWGGYQVAYIITRTNLFAAAMSGAPVSNMVSAYGGIRWESGVSRMFQYERSQSRLGATLWEKPFLYIENSPIFYADQIKTPLLLMHNDDDGAVPWYQGIELFTALRRLNKPVWMLTYNGEKHGLIQWQNKKDFSIRRMQFFDYYLKYKPEPAWMKNGVPAIEKGIKPHYELLDE